MRHAWLLVFALACSTNARTTPAERAKDAIPVAERADAAPPSADAIIAGPTPTPDELDDALGSLDSEHGAPDIRNVEWWRANAARVRPQLRAMLEDGTDDLQSDSWAIRILGDIGDPADVALLATVLTTWPSEIAQMDAAAALGVHPAPEAGEALIAATSHPDVDTASYAADGLGRRKGDAAARTRLEELLDHPTSTMRFHAVNALAKVGGGRAALVKRKKIEKNGEVKAAIARALKQP